MKKLVILRGKPTSGKSTAFHNLKKSKKLKDWSLINHPKLKDELGKEKAKLKLFELIKKEMKKGKNILTEETSRETIKKYIGKEVKEYKYKLIIFQFEVSLNEAYKRNIQRAKDKWHDLMTKKEMKEKHKMHKERFDKKAILINCNKLNKEEVVNLILKKLK